MKNSSPRLERQKIDIGAFFFALIIAPISVAVLGCWILLMPVIALIIGGLPYLFIGGPVMAVFLRYRKPSIGAFALLGVITNFATHVLARVLIGAGYMTEYSLRVDFVFMWGMVFAPIWAGTFAYIYCKSAIPSKIGPILNQ